MKLIFWRVTFVAALMIGSAAHAEDVAPIATESAQNETPPSEAKRALILRFMKASGLQGKLDNGSFLERYAFLPELAWHKPGSAKTLLETITGPIDALKAAYQKYRPAYQTAYEEHINWEFTEPELAKIVEFLESPVGCHYLDGTWRMEAYTNTNMEETEAALVEDAIAAYNRK